MANLIPLSELSRDRNYSSEGTYDPSGKTAYAEGDKKVGTVRSAMVEPDTGKIRYLLVDVGGWFSSKEVLVPVGMARMDDDAVYFDNLTKDQVKDMREYRAGDDYNADAQNSDERVLRGNAYAGDTQTDRDMSVAGGAAAAPKTYNYRDEDQSDTMFKTPEKLRLLEERLTVDKDRYTAGSVEIGKHVETEQRQVNVNLAHDELVIERHPVEGGRPVEGNATLGADKQVVHVDLEAERANVSKQAYVTEEVEVGKRTESESRTFTESVGREVLDVNRTGDVEVQGGRDANLNDDKNKR